MQQGNAASIYHVRITLKERGAFGKTEDECNLSLEELEEFILRPYRSGKSMLVRGRTITVAELERIEVFASEEEIIALIFASLEQLKDVTKEMIRGPLSWEVEGRVSSHQGKET